MAKQNPTLAVLAQSIRAQADKELLYGLNAKLVGNGDSPQPVEATIWLNRAQIQAFEEEAGPDALAFALGLQLLDQLHRFYLIP